MLQYKRLFAKVDAILDKASSGPLWLADGEVATLVQRTLLDRYAHLYTLWAYVVMANHLHILLRPKSHEISWRKSRSASRATQHARQIGGLNELGASFGRMNHLITGVGIRMNSFVSSITLRITP